MVSDYIDESFTVTFNMSKSLDGTGYTQRNSMKRNNEDQTKLCKNGIRSEEETSMSIEFSDSELAAPERDDPRYGTFSWPIHQKGQFQTERDFQMRINALKLESSKRFQDSWNEILQKYAAIDDEKESDEIDLRTGKIIKDNGHLRSLSLVGGSKDGYYDEIWSFTNGLEKDLRNKRVKEYRERLKKKELRKQLKDQHLFHNTSMQLNSSPIKADDINEYGDMTFREENLLSLNPSPTKKLKPSSGSEFDIFSSPLKKGGSTLMSPEKSDDTLELPFKTSLLHFDDIPSLDHGFESSTPKKLFRKESTKQKTQLNISNPFLEDQEGQRKIINHINEHLPLKRGTELYAQSKSKYPVVNAMNSSSDVYLTTEESHGCHTKSSSISESNKLLDVSGDSFDLDFDERFSIVTNIGTDKGSTTDPKIFACAFDGCNYCTGNKYIYLSHLISSHSDKLHSIGYPVDTKSKCKLHVTDIERKKLVDDFPLTYNVPKLPLSSDGLPYKCNKLSNGNRCQKFFLTEDDLREHQTQMSLCSSKRQVLICPLLGCGYMTEQGYLEWRSHFIERKHHIDPRYLKSLDARDTNMHTDISIKEQDSKLKQISCFGVPDKMTVAELHKEVNDIFSDVSSNTSKHEEHHITSSEDEFLASSKNRFSLPSLNIGYARRANVEVPVFDNSIAGSFILLDQEEGENDNYESIEELFKD